MKKICIYNNKGGVAKTTSVINVAYALHKTGKKVLVVDCDMQQNSYNFFLKNKEDGISSTAYENISNAMYEAYRKCSDKELKNFDYILFDLPPTLNEEVMEIINTSDKVYVPMMLRQFELAGLKKLTEVCSTKLGGIFITMYEKADKEILDQFRSALKDRMMKAVIPYSRTVINSQREMLPLEEYFIKRGVPRSLKNSWKVVDAYTDLADEIIGGNK
jgi:chromosome partitioning protein